MATFEQKTPCLFYSKGYCKNGAKCPYVHSKGIPNSASISEPCRYFKMGKCHEGSNCPYLHSSKTIPSINSVIPKIKSSPTPNTVIMHDNSDNHMADSVPLNTIQTRQPNPSSVNDMWGFQSDRGTIEDGVYFYGVGGLNIGDPINHSFPPVRAPDTASTTGPKWTDIATKGARVDTDTTVEHKEIRNVEYCRFFAQGACRFGQTCKYFHDPNIVSSTIQVDQPRIENIECGICFSDIVGDLGLLDGCSHVFCLECIRGWREKGLEYGEVESVRRCPICRLPAHLVIPSPSLPKNEIEKQQIIDQYRATLRRIPCKHYEHGVRTCPFGTSCLYAHVLEDGVTLAPVAPPRLLVNEEGKAAPVGSLQVSDYFHINS